MKEGKNVTKERRREDGGGNTFHSNTPRYQVVQGSRERTRQDMRKRCGQRKDLQDMKRKGMKRKGESGKEKAKSYEESRKGVRLRS
jgi:hypothetical protein